MALIETIPIEQLFLEFPIHRILNNTAGVPLAEPWATNYVDAIRDCRFGDAVWARYHIEGDVSEGGIIPGTDLTALESIKEDAREASVGSPGVYAKAVLLYSNTSHQDGHMDVIEIILRQ